MHILLLEFFLVYFEHKICLCYSIWDLFSEPIPIWNFRFSADRTCVCPSCCCCSTSYLPDIPQTVSNLIELSCWLRRWNWILIEANISKWIFPFFPALVVAVHFESVCVLAWVCVCVCVFAATSIRFGRNASGNEWSVATTEFVVTKCSQLRHGHVVCTMP